MKTIGAIAAAAMIVLGSPAARAQAPGTGSSKSGPDVVVTGKHTQLRKCEPHDKTCIALVAKAIYDQYPQQAREYCMKQQMNAFINYENTQAMHSGDSVSAPLDSPQMPPAMKAVCDYVDAQTQAEKDKAADRLK